MHLFNYFALWKLNTIVILFFVTVAYNGCSEVKFEEDVEAIQSTLDSSAAVFINKNDKFTNNTEVTLTISADQADEMMISNDDKSETEWEVYSKSKTWNLNGENQQVNVYVKFRSRGIETPNWVTDSIIHDNIAPTASNTVAPNTWTNKKIADLEFQATDNLSGVESFQCSAKKEDVFNPCKNMSPKKAIVYLGGLKEGEQYYYVTATDQAGNTSEPQRARWNIDLTPPTVRFIGSLPTLTNSRSTPFQFVGLDDASGIAGFYCRIDEGSWLPCSSSDTITVKQRGKHQLAVIARDNAGNSSPAAIHKWEVELSAPIITFDNPLPSILSNERNTQIGFHGKDKTFVMTEFKCRLNTGSYQDCTSPFAVSNLNHGTQLFRVKGKDRFGEWSQDFVYSFIVDLQISRPNYSSTPSRFTKSPVSQFDINSNDGDIVKYHCKIDGGSWTDCPGGKSPRYDSITEGAHSLQARVEDHVGNVSDVIYYNWVYDKTPPRLNMTGPEGRTSTPSAEFDITISDNVSTNDEIKLECDLDGQGFKDCQANVVFPNLKDGLHTLIVKATDQAGNQGFSPIRSFTVDTTPAEIVIVKAPVATYFEGENVAFLFNVQNGGFPLQSLTCHLNGTNVNCKSGTEVSLDGLVADQYKFEITVIDDVGHTSRKELLWQVKPVEDCNLSNDDVCIVLRDNFERDDLFDESFGWNALYHDTGDTVEGLEISIQDKAAASDGSKYVSFTGREGASVHSLYLISKPFNLSKYNRVEIGFDYLLASLEQWQWDRKRGPEFLKIDICFKGSFQCGVSENTAHARAKLNNDKLWKNVFSHEANKPINQHLNGRNHKRSDYINIISSDLQFALIDLGTQDYSKILFRIHTKMDEGVLAKDPDSVLIDNVSIKAFK